MNKNYSFFDKAPPVIMIIIMVYCANFNIHAQVPMTPGNTPYTVEYWLKADDLTLPNNAQIAQWVDFNGKVFTGNASVNTAGSAPKMKYDGMNFNPAVNFSSPARRMVSSDILVTDANRSYLTFYVSKSDLTGTTAGAVFAYRNNHDEGWVGNGSGTNYLYYYNGTITNFPTAQGLGKVYGIIGFERNTTGGATAYHNAKKITASNARPLTSANGVSVIGTRTATGTSTPFYGDIQEIIVLSTPSGMPFSQTEIQKINSYLAIKYGQMLDPSSQPNLYNASNEIVWDATINSGYNNNIFGIGRDDAMGLYQKQSMSVDSNEEITFFVGNDAKPSATNGQNNGTLNNGEFLMLGFNDMESTNRIPYDYAADTPFENDNIAIRLDYRRSMVLKSQLTGTTSLLVNVYVGILKVNYVLVSADPNFPNSNTRIYPVDEKLTARDLLINDNEYLGFAYQVNSPAGISEDLRLWLKADEPSTIKLGAEGDPNQVQVWRDYYGNIMQPGYENLQYQYERISISRGFSCPPGFKIIDPAMNYHSAVTFRIRPGTSENDGDREYLVTDKGAFSQANPDAYTIFNAVHLQDMGYFDRNNRSHFIGWGPDKVLDNNNIRRPAMGYQSSNGMNVGRMYRSSDGGDIEGAVNLYATDASTIGVYINQNTSPTYVRFEADAYAEQVSVARATSQMMNNYGTLGAASRMDRAMIGSMSEVIAYERILTDAEKYGVYSYLALKYGITLDLQKPTTLYPNPPNNTNVNFDYTLSDLRAVWQGTSGARHQEYHNNVAALVRDDVAKLNNMQSHSTDEGSTVLMGIGQQLGDKNPLLTGLENNMESIIWGNNRGNFNPIKYNPLSGDECGSMTSILSGRIWMVDVNTEQNYPVIIAAGNQGFNAGSNAFPYSGANWAVTLLIADSDAKLKAQQWDLAIPGVFINDIHALSNGQRVGLHHFGFIFEAGKTYYFTFGAKEAVGNCLICDVQNRFKSLTFNSNTWKNGWTSADFILNDNTGFTTTINTGFVGTGNARFTAGYPRAKAGTLFMKRTGTVEQKMVTVIELDTAAMVSFDLRKIDRASSRYTNVAVYGKCGDGTIIPSLNYATTQRRSFYAIDNESGVAKANVKKPSGSASAGNRNAWMYVDFDDPVHRIVIEHHLTGRTGSALKYFFLGPLTFACPAPPPPVNEDGLSLVQQAMPQELRLCEIVTYAWRIQNANCDEKTGKFSVTLPEGMLWEKNSLSINDINIENAIISNYGGTETLTIENLTLLPNVTTIFRARAYFKMDAAAGEYSNRAQFNYESNITPLCIISCDRMSAGCEPTTVTALPAPDRMFPLEIVSFSADKSHYKANDIVKVTIVINNPNPQPIAQVALDVIYNEEFNYQPESLTSDISGIGVPELYRDDETGLPLGGFSLTGKGTGFIIAPSGQHTISFQLKAPSALMPEYDYDGKVMLDENGDTLYTPLSIAFEFGTLSEEDDCSASVFYDAYGEIEIEAAIHGYYAPYGTVFPFVHTGDETFDNQFVTTAKLYKVPPTNVIDKLGYIRKQTPIQTTLVTYYDCTVDKPIIGAPKNPGVIGNTNNPGLPIRWTDHETSSTATTTASDKCTDLPIGKYIFTDIAPGDYLLEISRQGFLVRYGVITVTGNDYLGHRELIAGDVNGD
ncbi:MAG: hypothetical protein FWF09_04240, partial [Bacteroidales bacterium]|nr:hypothetical protein [Bacteroidales bacterium]